MTSILANIARAIAVELLQTSYKTATCINGWLPMPECVGVWNYRL